MKSLSLISCLIALTAANNAVSAFAPTTPPSKSFLIAPSAATNKEILTKKSSHAFFMSSGDEVETKKETTWDRITGPKLFKYTPINTHSNISSELRKQMAYTI
uniref:PS II complex 12 kDa extrinsic protein n=1 Tax=Ditylum brightwellii TaxID=49249 RepID=A0A7S4QL02_9STRA